MSAEGDERIAAWAEERVRELAVMYGIPDGGRYINDWREHKQLADERERRYREALEEIAGLYELGPAATISRRALGWRSS